MKRNRFDFNCLKSQQEVLVASFNSNAMFNWNNFRIISLWFAFFSSIICKHIFLIFIFILISLNEELPYPLMCLLPFFLLFASLLFFVNLIKSCSGKSINQTMKFVFKSIRLTPLLFSFLNEFRLSITRGQSWLTQ